MLTGLPSVWRVHGSTLRRSSPLLLIGASFVCTPQVQSNALAALEAIDSATAEEVLREGTITGDRINGLCDGFTGEW